MRLPHNKGAGFTLMEVLVALVILALVGVMLVQTTQNSTSQSDYLVRKVVAVWVAQDRITAMRLSQRSGQAISLGDETLEQAGRKWRTRASVEKQATGLARVNVDVFQPENATTSLYSITTFVPLIEIAQ